MSWIEITLLALQSVTAFLVAWKRNQKRDTDV
jgi:hypothetical protein